MWILTQLHTGDKLYLIPEVHKYTVGRAGSNIVLRDDTSISRSHATLLYTSDSLMLEDTGSKYGTYHNENIANKAKLSKGIAIELKEGDRILFGVLKNEWIVSKMNISAMTSALSGPQTTEIQSHLKSLGGKLILKWEPSCTHLTMSEITITIKVLHALIEKIPIVSCEFWKDYLKNVKEQKPLPDVGMYLPKPSAQLSSAINCKNFDFNDRRKTLFSGKTFVFMSKKHYDMYSQIIKKAGGECKDLKSNIHKSFLLQKNVIIVQYIASTQSQGSQTVSSITEYLGAHSIRTIPEYEIGLAIVCCTTETYCNPAYHTISHVLPDSPTKTPNIGTILAENTHSQKSQINTSEPMVIEISDSELPRSTTVQSNALESEIYEEKSSKEGHTYAEPDTSNTIRNISNVLVDDFDTPKSGSLAFNSCSKQTEKYISKRRRKSNMEEECNSAKKVHLLQEEVIPSTTSCSKNVSHINSRTDEKKANDVNPKPSHKTKSISKDRNSGFLQKSQINRLDKDITENRSETGKRGRIACITDNGSDGEDDIFNFGSPAKKNRRTSCNSDDELFAFGNKGAKDTVDPATKLSEDVLEQTQPFIAQNNPKAKFLSKIKISPVKPSSEGWLSKLNMLKIKTDNDVKTEIQDKDDPCKIEWIDSIKGAFEVRIRKMNLSTKENSSSKAPCSSDATLNTSKKNFKTFVKKNNYKPQTLVIRTSRR